jgi:hypothetical protein
MGGPTIPSLIRTNAWDREFGIGSLFNSRGEREAYHRINVEYLLALGAATEAESAQIISNTISKNSQLIVKEFGDSMAPVAQNIQALSDTLDGGIQHLSYDLQSIRSDLSALSGIVEFVAREAVEQTKLLQQLLSTLSAPRRTSASEPALLAFKNMQLAAREPSLAEKLYTQAVGLLQSAIATDPYYWKAHFDLGWLLRYHTTDIASSETHFDQAFVRAYAEEERNGAVLAARHLAEVRAKRGNARGAWEVAHKACDIGGWQNGEAIMEFHRYVVRDGQIEYSLKELTPFLIRQPAFFAEAFTTPEFMQHGTIIHALVELHDRLLREQVEQFRQVKQRLEQNPNRLSYTDLAGRIDSEMSRIDRLIGGLQASTIGAGKAKGLPATPTSAPGAARREILQSDRSQLCECGSGKRFMDCHGAWMA